MSAPNKPHAEPEHKTAENLFENPVLVSRTATDYTAHRLDAIPYVGNDVPRYMNIIWLLYISWASWYMVANYIPDIKLWFSKDITPVIYGGYDQEYWARHVEGTDEAGFLKKLNVPEKMKKLQGQAPAAPAGEAPAGEEAAAPAAESGGGMSFPDAVPAEGVKVETEDM